MSTTTDNINKISYVLLRLIFTHTMKLYYRLIFTHTYILIYHVTNVANCPERVLIPLAQSWFI